MVSGLEIVKIKQTKTQAQAIETNRKDQSWTALPKLIYLNSICITAATGVLTFLFYLPRLSQSSFTTTFTSISSILVCLRSREISTSRIF